jgi:hypothetical protein
MLFVIGYFNDNVDFILSINQVFESRETAEFYRNAYDIEKGTVRGIKFTKGGVKN